MNLNDGLSNYVKIYEDYLKTNVEIVKFFIYFIFFYFNFNK